MTRYPHPERHDLPNPACDVMGRVPTHKSMQCRNGCGACCIAPSITSALPGMPRGKPAGVPCVQLLPDMRCAVFGQPERPAFCGGLQPSPEMCGADREAALVWLTQLDVNTSP